MPLQKLQFKPGIIRDVTSLANEGGWYSCDKVRFRNGYPQKLGGWARISANVYQGICRSLSIWRTRAGSILTGVGTHLKMYIEWGGAYYDITPLRSTTTIASNAFTTATGSAVVVVNHTGHGGSTGDYVTLSGSSTNVGGILAATFNGEFQITALTVNTYSITVGSTASSIATGGNTVAAMQLSVGGATDGAPSGAWGAGPWSGGSWGSSAGTQAMRVWTQVPYGQNLIYGQRGGAPYQWTPDSSPSIFTRGVALSTLPGASSVPLFQFQMLLEQSSRILILFGSNGYGTTTYDPMMVRWSDANSVVEWAPTALTQAGEYVLPTGSLIVSAVHYKQDILVITDTAVYTMQYVGAPFVFSFAQQADNISIVGPGAAVATNGIVYWMGHDKFYMFDGKVNTLNIPINDEVFGNRNRTQSYQTIAGTSEGFSEVWWIYCSEGASYPDRYVVYNYGDGLWYYGTLSRTAWLDSGFKDGPIAATLTNNIVTHEVGFDDLSTASTQPISSFIESSDFDIGDGHAVGFVRSMHPDVAFDGSTALSPTVSMTVRTRNNPGAPHNAEIVNAVSRTGTVDVEQWTQQVFMRARGRQMSLRMASTDAGVQWRLGTPRIDIRPDGRRS